MCFAQGPQRSDAGEDRTRILSISSKALYHWATELLSTKSVKQLHVHNKNKKYKH